MKKIIHTKRGLKQDRNFISSQPWEIEFVQQKFYKKSSSNPHTCLPFLHPSVAEIKDLIKKYNNKRQLVYAHLRGNGFKDYKEPRKSK